VVGLRIQPTVANFRRHYWFSAFSTQLPPGIRYARFLTGTTHFAVQLLHRFFFGEGLAGPCLQYLPMNRLALARASPASVHPKVPRVRGAFAERRGKAFALATCS
jgi:hypothetical protein